MAPKTRAQARPAVTFPNLHQTPRITKSPSPNHSSATYTSPSSSNLKRRPVNAFKSSEDSETIIVFTEAPTPSKTSTEEIAATQSRFAALSHSRSGKDDELYNLGRYNLLCDQLDWVYDRAWKAFEQRDEGVLEVFIRLLGGYTAVDIGVRI